MSSNQSAFHPQPSPAFSDWTASTTSPMLPEKPGFQSPIITTAIPEESHNHHHIHLHRHHTRHARIKHLQHYDSLIGYVLSIISVSLTSIMDGIMVYVLYKFYTTKDIPAPGRTSPWAKGTKLWPAFLLLVGSFLTLCFDIVALGAAFLTYKRRRSADQVGEKRALRVESTFNKAGYVVFVVKWVTVFILYRVGKTSKDLWGWSCDGRAKKIQQYYIVQLNFDELCREQTAAWYLSIAEMSIKVILMVSAFWLARQLKKINRASNLEA